MNAPFNFDALVDTLADRVAARVLAQLQPPPETDRDDEWLTATEAAKVAKLSPSRLETLRREGGGPAFSRDGRRVRYLRRAVNAWLARDKEKTK